MTTSGSESASALRGGPSMEDRRAKLADGADEIVSGSRRWSLLDRNRILLTLAASLTTAGVVAILLGWLGASQGLLVEEQVPYLISGGLLGVALAFIGSAALLAHWLTVMIQENRAHELARKRDHDQGEANRRREHEELLQALRASEGADNAGDGSAAGTVGRARRTNRMAKR